MHSIIRINVRVSDERAVVEALLYINNDANVNGHYKSKNMLMFNEILNLRQTLTRMSNVCE